MTAQHMDGHAIVDFDARAVEATVSLLDREFALAEISPVLRFPAAQAISFHFIDYMVLA